MKNKNLIGKGKVERVSGDALFYFCLHNLISVSFFFLFTLTLDVYSGLTIQFYTMFTQTFWRLVLDVCLFSIISSVIGRITAFILMRWYLSVRNKRKKKTTLIVMKKWGELNKGINSFHLGAFLITVFFTSLIYCIGLVSILQNRIFNEDTSLFTLICTYILCKLSIHFLVRWLTRAKS